METDGSPSKKEKTGKKKRKQARPKSPTGSPKDNRNDRKKSSSPGTKKKREKSPTPHRKNSLLSSSPLSFHHLHHLTESNGNDQEKCAVSVGTYETPFTQVPLFIEKVDGWELAENHSPKSGSIRKMVEWVLQNGDSTPRAREMLVMCFINFISPSQFFSILMQTYARISKLQLPKEGFFKLLDAWVVQYLSLDFLSKKPHKTSAGSKSLVSADPPPASSDGAAETEPCVNTSPRDLSAEADERLFDHLMQFLAYLPSDGSSVEANRLKLTILRIRTQVQNRRKARNAKRYSAKKIPALSMGAAPRTSSNPLKKNHRVPSLNDERPRAHSTEQRGGKGSLPSLLTGRRTPHSAGPPERRISKSSLLPRSARQRSNSMDLIRSVNDGVKVFGDIPVLDIANEMALTEWKIFSRINAREFFMWHSLSESPFQLHSSKEARHLRRLQERFHYVSLWVATTVTGGKDVAARVQIIKRFLVLAQRCRELQHFNAVMEIISGLTLPSVARLGNTWDALPEKFKSTFQGMQQLMEVMNNHERYVLFLDGLYLSLSSVSSFSSGLSPPTSPTSLLRSKLSSPPPSPTILPCPVIPYIGGYLRHIDAIESGFPSRVTETGLINWEKMRMMEEVVSGVLRWQKAEMKVVPNPSRTLRRYVKLLSGDPEEKLNEMSLRCEPRTECTVDGAPLAENANGESANMSCNSSNSSSNGNVGSGSNGRGETGSSTPVADVSS